MGKKLLSAVRLQWVDPHPDPCHLQPRRARTAASALGSGAVLFVVVMIGTLWVAGEQGNWPPVLDPPALPQEVMGAASGSVADGVQLFHERGCQNCHAVAHLGGKRGPDLTHVGHRLANDQLVWRILNGGVNMPGFAGVLTLQEVDELVVFLQTGQ